ncbi:MAG: hypothetical protein OEN01_01765 [Candidatus Krumholzibacteria bacterium]|nr:hypothetical protein [Candidatus Krumholzibacteria bacterium]
MIIRTVSFLVAVLVARPFLGAEPAAAGKISGADISGTWQVNTELSDDPREMIQKKTEKMRAGRGGGGFRGGRNRRGGFAGGRGGADSNGGRGGPNREQMQERFRQLEDGRRNMVIEQKGDEVAMIYASGDTMTIVPDGKTHKQKTAAGEVEIEARWKDLALEVKIKGSNGAAMTRLYRLSADGRLEMIAFVELPRGNELVEIITVYDEVKLE